MELSKLQSGIIELQQGLDNRCTKDEFRDVTDQLQRFALYEDYKSLYEKVVPPIFQMEKVATAQSQEFAQFREIIRQIDENLQQRALKTDLNPIHNRFRLFVKEKHYLEFKNNCLDRFEEDEEVVKELDERAIKHTN